MEDLERVPVCPLCGSAERQVLHDAIEDDSFRCAPGRWTLWRCRHCAIAYLDPRPSPASIHRAYESYYTHDDNPELPGALNWKGRLRLRLVNGYMNRRFGSTLSPASRFGPIFCALLPRYREEADRDARHLPNLRTAPRRLLDIGCGRGDFLNSAARLGWDVMGLEPDHHAATKARARGIEVICGGIDQLAGQHDLFNAITVNHVIEHVHDAPGLLSASFRLLKPGGSVWISTPNIDSVGHAVFGRHWRGLEAPRHLLLFNRDALVGALRRAGFVDIHDCRIPSPRRWLFKRSAAMSMGRPATDDVPLSAEQEHTIRRADAADRDWPAQREFLVLQATKA